MGGTNFRRLVIQVAIFLWLIQTLKAVAMGVVAAMAFFWSSKPNPANAGQRRKKTTSHVDLWSASWPVAIAAEGPLTFTLPFETLDLYLFSGFEKKISRTHFSEKSAPPP
jgi:hypothetical protein